MGVYKLTPDAEADLHRIWLRGVRKHGEVQADKYYFAFFDRFEKIAEQPYLYQAVDHIRAGYRHSVCGVDTIYYRIEGDTVEIMNILGQQNTDGTLN
jgi:toxin ParE1/3/4